MSSSGKVISLIQFNFSPSPNELTSRVRAVSTMSSHASIAEARRVYDWSVVTTGPVSYGCFLSCSGLDEGSGSLRSASKLSSDFETELENKFDNEDDDKSITRR